VDVLAGGEGPDQAGVVGEVGDHPQLDLVVVGHEQLEAGSGDEGAAELAPLLGAHRDVVQVRLVGAEPAGPGHGLLEGGVDATVARVDLRQQARAVGRAQLLDGAVPEQRVDDRVLALELLQGGGIGGEAGLRLLVRGQPEGLEQHRAQLRRGVHLELDARLLLDAGLEHRRLGGEPLVERLQLAASTPTPGVSMRARTRTSGRSIWS
jgi:hypothetical protein